MSSRFRRGPGKDDRVEVKVIQETPRTGAGSRVSEYARVAGAAAQVLMLVVVALGYILTVRPIVQHELLKEEAAGLELKILEREEQLDSLEQRIAEADARRQQLQDQLAREISQKEQMTAEVDSLQEREDVLTLKIADSVRALSKSQNELESARWEMFVNDLYLHSLSLLVEEASRTDENDWTTDHISREMRTVSDPYTSLLTIIEKVQVNSERAAIYPARFFELATEHVHMNRENLTCDEPDFDAMNQDYHREIAALQPLIQEEIEKSLEESRQEARSRGHVVEFTDTYLRQLERSIAIEREWRVFDKYESKVESFIEVCERKRRVVMSGWYDVL